MHEIMKSVLIAVSLIATAMAASPAGVELRPGEAVAEALFEKGIGQPWVGGDPPSGIHGSVFSQYFWMPSWSGWDKPRRHIEIPRRRIAPEVTPSRVYLDSQMQALPYSQYQSLAGQSGGNSLWIEGSSSWSRYVLVPPGSALSLLAVSSGGENGVLYEIGPDGVLRQEKIHLLPGRTQINFSADSIGQHILLFAIGSQTSNAVVIDVKAPPPSGGWQGPFTLPG